MYTAAQKAASLSRSLGVGGRDRTISHLPAPLDGWSDSRDTAAPPQQSFRSWLASAEGRATMREASKEGAARRAEDHQEEQ
jgi:L-lactate dehydrogenase complex protein LldF